MLYINVPAYRIRWQRLSISKGYLVTQGSHAECVSRTDKVGRKKPTYRVSPPNATRCNSPRHVLITVAYKADLPLTSCPARRVMQQFRGVRRLLWKHLRQNVCRWLPQTDVALLPPASCVYARRVVAKLGKLKSQYLQKNGLAPKIRVQRKTI